MTQTPESLSVAPGDTISISCKASLSVSTSSEGRTQQEITWFYQKPGLAPKLLIYEASFRASGVSDRFTGSGFGTDFTLSVRDFQAEDAGVYYCQQEKSWPLTMI